MLLTVLPPLSLAAPPPYATGAELIAELNRARTQPRRYAEQLREYRRYFRGKIVYYPGRAEGLSTAEGIRAVDEAITFLEKQAPVAPLSASALLAHTAGDHVAEQGPRGATGHYSADGSNPRDRAMHRGGGNYVAEVITYGPPSPVEVVRQLIIDDAVPAHGHRRTVFAAEMVYARGKCGPHASYRTMCVIEFGRTPDGR